MPLPILEAHLDAIPSLMAEEALAETTRIAFGTGAMDEQSRREVSREWRNDLDLVAFRPKDPDSLERLTSQSGIGIRRHRKDPTRDRITRKSRPGAGDGRQRPAARPRTV